MPDQQPASPHSTILVARLLNAALAAHEAAVRATVADEIEAAEADDHYGEYGAGLNQAAAIARGETTPAQATSHDAEMIAIRDRIEAEARTNIDPWISDPHTREVVARLVADEAVKVVRPEIDAMWDQIHRDQHAAMDAHATLDRVRAYARWCDAYDVEPDPASILAVADGTDPVDYAARLNEGTRPCHRATPHDRHDWMSGVYRMRCPGEPITTSDGKQP